MWALTFVSGTLEKECTLMCSILEEEASVGKYDQAAAPVLAGKCTLLPVRFSDECLL